MGGRLLLIALLLLVLVGCGPKPSSTSRGKPKPKPKPPTVARVAPKADTVPANAFSDIPAALAALKAACESDTVDDIRKAQTWLAQQGVPAVAPLTAEMNNTEEKVPYRLACCRSLAELGSPATNALHDAMSSDVPLVRMKAVEALGTMRPVAPRSVEKLVVLLDDPDDRVRQLAITSLERIGEPAMPAVEKLTSILNSDANETERDRAKRALKAINPRHKFFD